MRTHPLFGALLVMVLVAAYVLIRPIEWDEPDFWRKSTFWEWLATGATLLVLGSVVSFWFHLRQWLHDRPDLPRYVIAHFHFQGTNVWTSPPANLVGEADARAHAQQMGQQRNNGQQVKFDAARIRVERCGLKPLAQLAGGLQDSASIPGASSSAPAPKRVFLIRVHFEVTDEAHARTLKGTETASAPPERAREPAPRVAQLRLFVRCGDDAVPPDDGWQIVALPATLKATELVAAVKKVREAVDTAGAAQILIKGPVTLGVALGHALQHHPCKVDYLQLDQATKLTTTWWSNRHMA